MKTIATFSLFLFMLMGTLSAQQVHLVPSANDSTRMDTIVISEMVAEDDAVDEEDTTAHTYTYSSSIDFEPKEFLKGISIIPILGMIFVFGFPIAILGLILWFKYKNRQAKYKLMAQALAAGQPLPKEFINEMDGLSGDSFQEKNNKLKNKGIQGIFQGIGLGVFLWLLTEEIGLAAIGFMVFCFGLGQVIMAYTNVNKEAKDSKKDRDASEKQSQQPPTQE
ncbi:MAG: DUF6249 domain-containing protein [Phocaeicola sp.]